jgi:hypothetical protein
MRQRLQRCLAADPRLRTVPADPLAEPRKADVFVHPSFSERFGYAPTEGLPAASRSSATTPA